MHFFTKRTLHHIVQLLKIVEPKSGLLLANIQVLCPAGKQITNMTVFAQF